MPINQVEGRRILSGRNPALFAGLSYDPNMPINQVEGRRFLSGRNPALFAGLSYDPDKTNLTKLRSDVSPQTEMALLFGAAELRPRFSAFVEKFAKKDTERSPTLQEFCRWGHYLRQTIECARRRLKDSAVNFGYLLSSNAAVASAVSLTHPRCIVMGDNYWHS